MRALMARFDTARPDRDERYSLDGYFLTEEERNRPTGLTSVQLGNLSDWIDGLRILEEDELGLVAKYRDDTLSNWEYDMDGMVRLEGLYRDGELSREQEDFYRRIKASLKDRMPHIERLGLPRPPVPLG